MYPSISIKGRSRSRATLRSIIGQDYTEQCDCCGRTIDNGIIGWMGRSFLTFSGKFLCNNCRSEAAALATPKLVAKDCGKHFGARGGRCAKCALHEGYRMNGLLQYGGVPFVAILEPVPGDSIQERAIRKACLQ